MPVLWIIALDEVLQVIELERVGLEGEVLVRSQVVDPELPSLSIEGSIKCCYRLSVTTLQSLQLLWHLQRRRQLLCGCFYTDLLSVSLLIITFLSAAFRSASALLFSLPAVILSEDFDILL